MSRYENFTGTLYNTLKHNTALWRYLDKDQATITLCDNDFWFLEKNGVYADSINDKAYDQLVWLMENVFHKRRVNGMWYVPADKYKREQLLK